MVFRPGDAGVGGACDLRARAAREGPNAVMSVGGGGAMSVRLPKMVFYDDEDERAGAGAGAGAGARAGAATGDGGGVSALCILHDVCLMDNSGGDGGKDGGQGAVKRAARGAARREAPVKRAKRAPGRPSKIVAMTAGAGVATGGGDTCRSGSPGGVASSRPRVVKAPRDATDTEKARLSREVASAIKIADHRRLIYRWTNALIRSIGLRIPSGSGALFSRESKNKREKFDKFLLHYYGDESFLAGKYWYTNANAAAFFVEVFRLATSGRVHCDELDIWQVFEKKDPDRKASTWQMSTKALERLDISTDELFDMYSGEARIEDGWPRGRPLHVPPPSLLPVTKSQSTYLEAVQEYERRVGPAERGNGALSTVAHGSNIHNLMDELAADPKVFQWTSIAAENGHYQSLEAKLSSGYLSNRESDVSLCKKKAMELVQSVTPNADASPTEIMKPLFSESLEGLGPPATPCDRNNVNQYYSRFFSNEVIEVGDVTAAFMIRNDAIDAVEPFKKFTAAYFKVKAAKEEVERLSTALSSTRATVSGLKKAIEAIDSRKYAKSNEGAMLKACMQSRLAAIEPTVGEIDEKLESTTQREEDARDELMKVEEAAREPYLRVVKQCYELNSGIQDRMGKILGKALEDTQAHVEAQRAQLSAMHPSAANTTIMKELNHSFKHATELQQRLLEMRTKLDECRKSTAFALSTLDVRWKRFSI